MNKALGKIKSVIQDLCASFLNTHASIEVKNVETTWLGSDGCGYPENPMVSDAPRGVKRETHGSLEKTRGVQKNGQSIGYSEGFLA